MSAPTWVEVLDAFEARIEMQRRAIETDRLDDVPAFDAPSMVETIPARLRARAEDLLRSSLELELALSELMVTTARERDLVRRFARLAPHAVTTGGATYLDSSL